MSFKIGDRVCPKQNRAASGIIETITHWSDRLTYKVRYGRKTCRNYFENEIELTTASPRKTPDRPPCTWTYDDHNYAWDTTCGDKFIFDVDGPDENHYRFCPACGGKIAVTPYEAPAEEADDDGDE